MRQIKVIVMNKLSERNIRQFTKFNTVGVINTLIDFTVFYILNQYLNVFYSAAHIISAMCGMVNSYILNKHWTFKKNRTNSLNEVTKFILLNLSTSLITLLVFYLIKRSLPLSNIVIKIIVIFLSAILNFIGSRIWVFK